MRLVLLVLVLAAFATDAGPGFGAGGGLSTCPKGYIGGGLTPCTLAPSYAFFEFAPASGAGMGTACACTAVTGAKGEAMTFSRASAAECISNDDQTLIQCTTDQPRAMTGAVDSARLGLTSEPERFNILQYSRDGSQAVWSKTNMTCALTATGMRLAANSATTCTATAPGGYVCQVIGWAGAANYAGSIYIKRASGTGTISVSINGGSGWSDIDSRISPTVWRRVVPLESIGCQGGNCVLVPELFTTQAAPSLCVRASSSGDSFVFDFAQIDQGIAPSSPIESGPAIVQRAGEILRRDFGAVPPLVDGVGSIAMSTVGAYTSYFPGFVFASSISYTDATATNAMWDYSSGGGWGYLDCAWFNSTSTNYHVIPGPALRTGRHACQFGGVGTFPYGAAGFNSASGATPMAGTFAGLRYLQIGGVIGVTAQDVGGVVHSVCIDGSRTTCTAGASPSINATDVVWLGDSIVAGAWSYPLTPTEALHARVYPRIVHNLGVGGNTATQCGARYAALGTQAAGTVVWSCAVNDLLGDVAGATIASTATTTWASVRSASKKLIITGVMPFGGYVGWTAGRETQRQAYNAAAAAWAGSNGATFVSTDSMGTGSPLILTAANSGGVDGLHPSSTGAIALADLVNGAAP